ncbi:sulfite exporter TauE/SafE family protein [Roseovarius faecimaris]|uniref:Probable membrane transporter protein n=1 Tax=Roseovarius faecimaris TaxID=2494550 RepID=A0A6I6IRB6_9RHOB|nr:sulfite exporter TauE/SafE family protein [Roseovarius faecimaris]QGX98762.1 sulfite exporter TauE/SafE family protein [Roseovarius faecimaris]
MPDLLREVLATPGLIWLILTISVAGVVRGFTGFGTALIFVPVAGIFLPPTMVIAIMTLTGVASNAALLPRAWGKADRREVGTLALAAVVTVPLGLWLISVVDREVIRWIVSFVAAVTLVVVIAGWRYTGRLALPGLLGIGALSGLIGGLTGLTGPVVIMFYLASQSTAQSVRANTILFLASLDVVIVINLAFGDTLGWEVALLAAVLSVPYFITSLIGQALFDPSHERAYRVAAYGVIALALVSGLPIWN